MKLFIFCLLIAFQTETQSLKVKGLMKEYRRNEKIEYCIFNDNKNLFTINITLEALLDGKWEEITVDATRKAVKSAIIYDVKPGICKSFSYNLKDLDKALYNNGHIEIRFKIYANKKSNKVGEIFYSDKINVIK